MLPKSHLAKCTDPKILPQNILPDLYWGLLHAIGLVRRPPLITFTVAMACYGGLYFHLHCKTILLGLRTYRSISV